MMCAEIFSADQDSGRVRSRLIDRVFERCAQRYTRALRSLLRHVPGADRDGRDPVGAAGRHVQDVAVGAGARGRPGRRAVAGGGLANGDLRPDADLRAAGLRCRARHRPSTSRCSRSPACRRSTHGIGGVLLKPWDERTRSAARDPAGPAGEAGAQIAGARVAAFQFPPLPGSSGLPVQFVITHDRAVREPQRRRAAGDGQGAGQRASSIFIDSDLKLDTAAGRPSKSTATRSPRWA